MMDMMIQLMGFVAQNEREKIRERQAQGIKTKDVINLAKARFLLLSFIFIFLSFKYFLFFLFCKLVLMVHLEVLIRLLMLSKRKISITLLSNFILFVLRSKGFSFSSLVNGKCKLTSFSEGRVVMILSKASSFKLNEF